MDKKIQNKSEEKAKRYPWLRQRAITMMRHDSEMPNSQVDW